jgi:hypothetical protein
MPSSAETWGRTATEALCSGIPVIANPTNGLKENLGDAGLYVDRNAINDWVALIQKLKDDSDYYNAVSAKCKERSAILNSTNQLDTLISQIENVQNGGNRDLSGNIREHLDIILEYINNGKKFGLIRPNDGEYNILNNHRIDKQIDNWTFVENSKITKDLADAIGTQLDNLYVGVPSVSCSGPNF